MSFSSAIRARREDQNATDIRGKISTQSSSGFSASLRKRRGATQQVDLSTSAGLRALAEQKQLTQALAQFDERDKDKLSVLQRISVGVGGMNPAEAILRQKEGSGNFLIEYPKSVLTGITAAFTGKDVDNQSKRRFFSDVVEEYGIENKYAQFGLGLIGDIFLDPGTYLGGTILRLGVKAGAKALSPVGRQVAKKSPELAKAGVKFAEAGVSLKDAFGDMFVYGYATTKGLAVDALRLSTKKGLVLRDLAKFQLEKYGEKVLSPEQVEEFVGKLLQGKRAEFKYFDEVEKEFIKMFNKKYGGVVTDDITKQARKFKTAEEFAESQVTKFDDLSVPAKTAIQGEARVKMTNQGLTAEQVNPFKTKWLKKTETIDNLKATDPDVFSDTFKLRGSKTKGPIIVDKDGVVIDGNNRLREAFNRGDKTIEVFEEVTDKTKQRLTDIFNKAKSARSQVKFPLKDSKGAMGRLQRVRLSIPKKIGKLQDIRAKLARPLIAGNVVDLKAAIKGLRKELSDLIPKKVKGKKVTKEFTKQQENAGLMNALSDEKDKLKNIIFDLQKKLKKFEVSGVKAIAQKAGGKKSIELARQTAEQQIADISERIVGLQNELFSKEAILESVIESKTVAKSRIRDAFKTGDFSKLSDELAVALNPVSKDATVNKALQERLVRNKKLAKLADVEDPFTVYFPSIKKEHLNNFIKGTSELKVGSEGYKKEFRNLLKDEELLRNPVEAFFDVESKVVTNKMNRKFQKQTIKKYGKELTEFASESEAKKAGFRILREKGRFGKEVGYLNEADWKFMNGLVDDNYGAIDAIAKATGFDSATSLFKRWVTGPFAPFHIRNWVSGKIQNFLVLGRTALKPKNIAAGDRIATRISRGRLFKRTSNELEDDVLRGLDFDVNKVEHFGNETIELNGKTWRMNDVARKIEERFGGSSFYQTDFNSVTRDAGLLTEEAAFSKAVLKDWGKNFASLTFKKNPIKGLIGEDNPLFRSTRVVGTWIELSQKSEMVIAALDKGKTMNKALELAAKAGFDYRALTKFESKILRRIIPFYSFNRFNVELQLRTLGTNPQRINQVIRSVENVQNLFETKLTDEEKNNLPAYLKEFLTVPVGRTKDDVAVFVRNFGTPIEAFAELVRPTMEGKSSVERTFMASLSKVNPYIKVPIELAIGKDSFRNRDLKTVYNAREYQDAPQIIKSYLRAKKVQKPVFGTNQTREVWIADPERLLVLRSLFTSRGFTYLNNIFNGDAPAFMKIMDAVSGIRVTEVDIESQAGWRERERRDDYADILRREGVVNEFNKIYIPK